MTDYRKYINALRKCAKEHENDRTSTGHIIVSDLCKDTANLLEEVEQEPKTGHWSRRTKVDAYDIAGVKTWGIKCQCDRCDFTTIVVEDFGYYKYCPNCGCRMFEPQESEDKE